MTLKYLNRILLEEASAFIEHLPNKCVDLVLTDPPYNLLEDEIEYYHSEFQRISCHGIIVFMPPENPWVFPSDQYLFWEKEHSTKNTAKSYARYMEQIFVYDTDVWNIERHWSNYGNVFHDLVDTTQVSPHRKPPSLIERLILNHTTPGMIVFDPFAGSCIVAEVCMKTGRNFICLENDEYIHDMVTKQLRIF